METEQCTFILSNRRRQCKNKVVMKNCPFFHPYCHHHRLKIYYPIIVIQSFWRGRQLRRLILRLNNLPLDVVLIIKEFLIEPKKIRKNNKCVSEIMYKRVNNILYNPLYDLDIVASTVRIFTDNFNTFYYPKNINGYGWCVTSTNLLHGLLNMIYHYATINNDDDGMRVYRVEILVNHYNLICVLLKSKGCYYKTLDFSTFV